MKIIKLKTEAMKVHKPPSTKSYDNIKIDLSGAIIGDNVNLYFLLGEGNEIQPIPSKSNLSDVWKWICKNLKTLNFLMSLLLAHHSL